MTRVGPFLQRTIVFACAVVVAAAVARRPTHAAGSVGQENVYDWSTVLQLGLLLAAGITLLAIASLPVRRAAAIVAASAGAQLAGTGIVAHRRWITSAGFGARANNHGELQAMAVVLAIVGFVAVAAAVFELWRDGAIDRQFRWGVIIVAFAIAAVVAVWIPFAMGYEPFNRRTQVGAHALMYSLPWAGVLALSGLVDRITAAVAVGVVVISALPLTADALMIPAPDATVAASLALIAGVLVLASRWLTPDGESA